VLYSCYTVVVQSLLQVLYRCHFADYSVPEDERALLFPSLEPSPEPHAVLIVLHRREE